MKFPCLNTGNKATWQLYGLVRSKRGGSVAGAALRCPVLVHQHQLVVLLAAF